ncbi:hypothetical protein ILYODFUR_025321 [Ilyodon furcidens]|uniref:Uncharacterized protein n=1 Tax=Ilyodon furcidens TaxID=33524 RepID=A0ABV0VJG3_9TELE
MIGRRCLSLYKGMCFYRTPMLGMNWHVSLRKQRLPRSVSTAAELCWHLQAVLLSLFSIVGACPRLFFQRKAGGVKEHIAVGDLSLPAEASNRSVLELFASSVLIDEKPEIKTKPSSSILFTD